MIDEAHKADATDVPRRTTPPSLPRNSRAPPLVCAVAPGNPRFRSCDLILSLCFPLLIPSCSFHKRSSRTEGVGLASPLLKWRPGACFCGSAHFAFSVHVRRTSRAQWLVGNVFQWEGRQPTEFVAGLCECRAERKLLEGDYVPIVAATHPMYLSCAPCL